MPLKEKAVVELQKILEEEYEKKLTLKETEAIGIKLINIYQVIMKNFGKSKI